MDNYATVICAIYNDLIKENHRKQPKVNTALIKRLATIMPCLSAIRGNKANSFAEPTSNNYFGCYFLSVQL